MLNLRTERVAEWLKPSLVVPPLVDTVAIDRAPDLRCARCVNGTLVAVEVENGWVEWQAEEI